MPIDRKSVLMAFSLRPHHNGRPGGRCQPGVKNASRFRQSPGGRAPSDLSNPGRRAYTGGIDLDGSRVPQGGTSMTRSRLALTALTLTVALAAGGCSSNQEPVNPTLVV